MYEAYLAFKKQTLAPTPTDIEGPFYKAGAAWKDVFVKDATLQVTGQVVNVNNEPLKEAVLDIWQADAQGVYDNEGYHLRGKLQVDAKGNYKLETIRPGDYEIGPHEYRCSHIHVKVTAPGYKTLTTQLYFKDDKYNATDHWFDPRRIIAMPVGTFTFVLEAI